MFFHSFVHPFQKKSSVGGGLPALNSPFFFFFSPSSYSRKSVKIYRLILQVNKQIECPRRLDETQILLHG